MFISIISVVAIVGIGSQHVAVAVNPTPVSVVISDNTALSHDGLKDKETPLSSFKPSYTANVEDLLKNNAFDFGPVKMPWLVAIGFVTLLLGVIGAIVGIVRGGASDREPNPSSPADPSAPAGDTPDHELKQKLLSMQMPAMCGNESGKLVNGVLPAKYHGRLGDGRRHDGHLTLLTNPLPTSTLTNADEQIQLLQIDFDNNGEKEIVLQVDCYAGGVPWPRRIIVLNQRLEAINVRDDSGELNVLTEELSGYEPGRSGPIAFEKRGNALFMRWHTYRDNDPRCCASLISEGTFTFENGKLKPIGRVVTR